MSWNSRRGTAGIAALALVAAALLTLADARLASSQATTLVARPVDQVPLDDPFAAVWNRAQAVSIPLSAQSIATPKGGGTLRTVTARALHDGQRLYILAEWADATKDMSLGAHELFRDAVAVQFPVGRPEALPSFCMGQAGGGVNIWHWKADWQADIDQGRFLGIQQQYPQGHADGYPFEEEAIFYPARAVGNTFAQLQRTTPVEDLVALGFGTLTTAPDQQVQGKGAWRDGRWRALLARDFQAPADYPQFAVGARTSIAFAVWDGAKGERDGMKSVSQFVNLEVSSTTTTTAAAGLGINTGLLAVIIVGGLAALLVIGLFIWPAPWFRRGYP